MFRVKSQAPKKLFDPGEKSPLHPETSLPKPRNGWLSKTWFCLVWFCFVWFGWLSKTCFGLVWFGWLSKTLLRNARQ